MRARRSKDQIIVEILNICEKGENLTNIVYRSSISFASIKAYLAVLMKNDLLICQEGSPRIYKTTPKGLEIRYRMERLHKLMEGLKI